MNFAPGTRVAVVGARGIGRHHAKWWSLEGAQVCAFVGTSADSVAQTQKVLADLFGFAGRGYTDVGQMLAAEKPAIVDVCSPPHLHIAHARTALEAGCHVLCEKPLTYAADVPAETQVSATRALVELAAGRGLLLGMCAQFFLAGRICRKLLAASPQAKGEVTLVRGHLASPAKGRPGVPEDIWVELAPHLLGAAQALAPDGQMDRASLVTAFQGYEAKAGFEVVRPQGPVLRCELTAGRQVAAPPNIRRLELDGCAFSVEGANDREGVYCSKIETPQGVSMEPDLMRLMMREFLAGTPPLQGQAIVTNMEWMLGILAKARSR